MNTLTLKFDDERTIDVSGVEGKIRVWIGFPNTPRVVFELSRGDTERLEAALRFVRMYDSGQNF